MLFIAFSHLLKINNMSIINAFTSQNLSLRVASSSFIYITDFTGDPKCVRAPSSAVESFGRYSCLHWWALVAPRPGRKF